MAAKKTLKTGSVKKFYVVNAEGDYFLTDSESEAITLIDGTSDGDECISLCFEARQILGIGNADIPQDKILCFTADIKKIGVGTIEAKYVFKKTPAEKKDTKNSKKT